MQASGPRPGHFLKHLIDIGVLVIEDLRPAVPARHVETFRQAVNRDHALSAEQERALDRHLPYPSAAPNRDHLARLNRAHLGRHVPRRERVGRE